MNKRIKVSNKNIVKRNQLKFTLEYIILSENGYKIFSHQNF